MGPEARRTGAAAPAGVCRPGTPAAVRRPGGRARAVVVRCAALLAVLGILIPAAPGGVPVPGSAANAAAPVLGPAAAVLPDGGEDRERAGALCTSVDCDGQPRLNHSGPAERFLGASGAALLPERLLPAAPGCGPAPAPRAGGGTHVQDVLCPDGRAPPPSPGI